jgi:sigma-B regulation protein RsbU (phosphoserine phosphatase)
MIGRLIERSHDKKEGAWGPLLLLRTGLMDTISLELLVESSKVLNSTLDVDVLLSLTYDLVQAAVGCETCSLGRLSEKGDKMEILMAFGKAGPEVSDMRLTIDESQGVMGKVVRSGRVVVTNDPVDLAGCLDVLDRTFAVEKRSSLGVPLLRGGEVIGAVEAVNKEDGDFTEADVEIMTALAELIAIALDNARLYGAMRRESKQRELLFDVGTRVSSTLDLNEVMELILDSLRQVVDFDAGGVYIVGNEPTEIECVTARGYEPDMADRVELKFGEGVVGWVARNVEPVIIDDVGKDPRYLNARPPTRSEIVVPLKAGSKIVGVINLESDLPAGFGQEDLLLIQTFGSQAAISIEQAKLHMELLEKRRLKDQVELARHIQQTFLPDRLPDIPGYRISAINLPSDEVSGDYYDVIDIGDNQWGLVIADVFGKGIPAALVMASFRASLLAEIRNNYSISTIMNKVNRLIWESVEPERCVTACYGVLDAGRSVFTYSNAGHLYPMVIGPRGTERLAAGGMLLGVVDESKYEQERVHLRPGDLLLLFTDGLTEAENAGGEAYGEDRLADSARGLMHLPCDDIVRGIHQAIIEFSGGSLIDDFTMLAVKAEQEVGDAGQESP